MANQSKGLICKKCGCRQFDTVTTGREDGYIVRYKKCAYCGLRKKTYESEEQPDKAKKIRNKRGRKRK
jgi:predicted  nucleic acid-binding Zn-ribbon protein